jgi:outer membrane biosynthesis protein TonB
VRHCYNQGLARDPNLKGRLSVDFTVNSKGDVVAAVVAETTLADVAVGACITGAVRRWKFPGNPGGDVKIRYPFVLEPG